MPHSPVLLRQIIYLLALCPGDKVIDCTVGEGGHAYEILKAIGPKGKLLALDADKENIARVQENLKEFSNVIFVNNNFVHLKDVVAQYEFDSIKAILIDLGWSIRQFEESGRGFSFLRDEPLDMRLGAGELTAAEILNDWPEADIGKILREYGEEKKWKEIARSIVRYRKQQPFKTTLQLVEIIKELEIRNPPAGKAGYESGINPATKTFQALRIAVNDELNNLKKVLPQAVEVLTPGGRLAVITFHSLEDRIVKQYFKSVGWRTKIKLITKKPIVAEPEELKINPRARSAKLRVVERL